MTILALTVGFTRYDTQCYKYRLKLIELLQEDKLANGTDHIAVMNESHTLVEKFGCEHDRKGLF